MSTQSNKLTPFWLSCTAAWGVLSGLLWFAPLTIEPQLRLVCLLPTIVIIAWFQYLLVQLMHEAVHHCFARRGFISVFAAALTAYPVGMSRVYRDLHINHHKHFTEPEKDCDYHGYAHFPDSKIAMLKWLAWNISGLAAITQFFNQNSGQQKNDADSKQAPSKLTELVYLVIAQLTLLFFFTLHGQWWMYFIFWLLPLLTLVKSLSTIRLLAEHGDPKHTAVLRDFNCSWLMKNLIGPIGFGDHAKHHQAMGVPFAQLDSVQIDTKQLPVPYENYQGHHLQLLWQWFLQLPFSAKDKRKGSSS